MMKDFKKQHQLKVFTYHICWCLLLVNPGHVTDLLIELTISEVLANIDSTELLTRVVIGKLDRFEDGDIACIVGSSPFS